jgi:trimeric autotransporter adhesin
MLGKTRQTLVSEVFLFGLAVLFLVPAAFAQQKIYTAAGGYVGDGKLATSAALAQPIDGILAPNGDIIVSDATNCRIRRVDASGKISTLVGTGLCGFSGDGGPAANAQINFPWGLVLDAGGNLFFSDTGNSRVRKVDRSGTITTVAGNGTVRYCGDGGQATNACFNEPSALAVAGTGSSEVLVIADTFNYRIRQVLLKTGMIRTIAGNGTPGYSGDGGPATLASLNAPQGLAISLAQHALYISDTENSVIRSVDTETGIISTFFGKTECAFDGHSLCFQRGIFLDANENLYIADALMSLELPHGSQTVVIEAGVFQQGFNGDSIPAVDAMLNNPYRVFPDRDGNLLTVELGNNRVRKGAGSQLIATVAGGYIGDGGKGTSAALATPSQVAFDSNGNLYVADSWNNRIRKVSTNGTISTFAGTGLTGYSGDGGQATDAMLDLPGGVAVDTNGNVFIADGFNSVIRKVDNSGVITTYAGEGVLFDPLTVAIDSSGNVFTADLTCQVWKITQDGSINVVAGDGECGPGVDGVSATQSALNVPSGIALDPKGNLYIADTDNNRVRVVNSAGIINTVVGNGTCGFSGDGGPAKAAMICYPQGVAFHSNHLYIADTLNLRVRIVDRTGTIQTLAGTGNAGYNGNGLPAVQTNMAPTSITVDPSGLIGIEDLGSFRARTIR